MITLIAPSITDRVFGTVAVSRSTTASRAATGMRIVGERASVCGYGKDCASALRGSGACVVARQAYHLTQILRGQTTRSKPREQGKSEL